MTARVAPIGAEALWQRVRDVVSRLGIDADAALVTSLTWGDKRKLRAEIEAIGLLADALRAQWNPTARHIAAELNKALRDIASAQTRIRELADLHWPRRRLYEAGEALLSTALLALTAKVRLLQPEHDLLAAAPPTSKDNAASAETLFRQHMVRIWRELGGVVWIERQGSKDKPHDDMIDFLVAVEHLMLSNPKRETVRRWVVRNCRKPDTIA